MINSIKEQRAVEEAQAEESERVAKARTESSETDAIFRRMAKLPTPMAPDLDEKPAKAGRRKPKRCEH